MKKTLILIISLYFLILLQVSFLIHFKIFNRLPNIILISVILICLFQKKESNLGIGAAAVGGLLLDIFFSNFIGFYILILLVISLFIKFVIRSYVRVPV